MTISHIDLISEITPDPEHVRALAEMPHKTHKVRYALEHAPEPVTSVVRAWLAAHGVTDIRREQVSTIVNNAAPQVSAQPSTTPHLHAVPNPDARAAVADELDAPAPPPASEGDLVITPVVTPVVTAPRMDVPTEVRTSAPAVPVPPAPVVPAPAPAAPVDQLPAPARPVRLPLTGPARVGAAILLIVVAVLLAGVIIAPIALSSQDIIDWAGSPLGLGLSGGWPWVTFLALDAAAAVCVCLVVYCAWRGESAGIFGWLVWAFAGMSAFANYRHGSAPGSAADAVWFFPAMSVAGPFLLEMIVRRVRKWVQEGTGQRARHGVSFGLARWVPGVGALRETYGAWRLARLDGINDAHQAVTAYRELCPNGSVRVLKALRERR